MSLKNIIIAGMLSTSALMSVAANAEEFTNFYLQANVGSSLGMAAKKDFGNKKLGTSPLFGFEVGYKFDDHLRLGLGFDARTDYSFTQTLSSNENVKWKIKSSAAMLNLYYDIFEAGGFSPYMTLGVGAAKNTVTGVDTATNGASTTTTNVGKNYKSNFAYKAGLGARYFFNKNVAIDLRYQYTDLGKIQSATNTTTSVTANKTGTLRANEFLLGIGYQF